MKKYTKVKFNILLILVIAVLLIAALAPQLVPYDPYEQNLSEALKAPSAVHVLGTDQYGRDMFSRILMGAQTSIYSAGILVIMIMVMGTAIGLLCGWCGGKTDDIIMRISDVFLAFPGMVFAIAVAGVLGGGIISAVIALACISWPKYARITRSQVLAMKDEPFVAAARLAGTRGIKMVTRHILPNVMGPVLVTASLDLGTMMMELAGLSFLGLGAAPPIAEWGSMMSNGRSLLQTSPWVILSPGCAIFITVMIFNLFGDTLRDVLDKRGGV